MSDVMRSCRRTSCRWPAAASLSFSYATREVWLAQLPEQPHPAAYDLCPHHADSMTVPRGWQLVDRRFTAPLRQEPPDSEPAGAGATDADRPTSLDPAGEAIASRYAALIAELPRLAARYATRPAAPRTHTGDPLDPVTTHVVASRDLSPHHPPLAGPPPVSAHHLQAEARGEPAASAVSAPQRPVAPGERVTQAGERVPDEVDGQLAMPVTDTEGDAVAQGAPGQPGRLARGTDGGAVVPIGTASRREPR